MSVAMMLGFLLLVVLDIWIYGFLSFKMLELFALVFDIVRFEICCCFDRYWLVHKNRGVCIVSDVCL